MRRRLLVGCSLLLVFLVVATTAGYGYVHYRFGQIRSVDVPGLHKAGAGKAVVVATCLSVVVAAHMAAAAIGFLALFLAGVLRERQRTKSALGAPAVT